MSESRFRSLLVVATIAFAILILTIYVAGYSALSVPAPGLTPDDSFRIFESKGLATIYRPAANVERFVTGREVYCCP